MTLRSADNESILAAAEILLTGKLVAFPTETVYGLGADATQDEAVAKIYKVKGRPAINPLIVHVGRPDWMAGLCLPDGRVDALTRTLWPGPLTLVLRRRPDSPVSSAVSAGLDTIAVRQPNHPVAAHLLAAIKRPLAAPSANPSGHVSPTTALHVENDLGKDVDLILDGGPCQTGIESTILDLTTDKARILRPGAIAANRISETINSEVEHAGADVPILSPGQLEKHYAPGLPLRLNATSVEAGEALIGFGAAPAASFNLSAGEDLAEAAASLFAALRELDNPNRFSGIAVMPIPADGIGRAINDRLSRAAAGR